MSPSSCLDALAAAANVSKFRDTHEDLFPAYVACTSIEEWDSANAAHPVISEGVDPVQYAMNVCASNQSPLGDSTICRLVNKPQQSVSSTLTVSSRPGLLGVPIPEGARLIEIAPGNPAEFVDARETYAVSATGDEIGDFFDRAMQEAGWFKQGPLLDLALLYSKGAKNIGVLHQQRWRAVYVDGFVEAVDLVSA